MDINSSNNNTTNITAVKKKNKLIFLRKMLNRFKEMIIVDEDTSKKIRKLGPFLLLLSFIAYLLFGAACFTFFEKTESIFDRRQYLLHLGVSRRQFAREITQKIFNDTKNLFVVMDIEQSNRVHAHMVESLRDYERHLKIQKPSEHEWDFMNSLSYSLGQCTTLGYSTRTPKTIAGKLFGFIYSIIGVPFFMLTIGYIAYRIFQTIKKSTTLYKRHLHYLLTIIFIFVIFIIGYSYFLYDNGIEDTFWKSLYVTILSAFSIHTYEYSNLSEADKLTMFFAVAVQHLLGFIIFFYSIFVYQARQSAKVATTEAPTGEVPRYQVIVSNDGETKIQPAP